MFLKYCVFIVLIIASHLSFADEEIPSEEYLSHMQEFLSSFKKQMQGELNLNVDERDNPYFDLKWGISVNASRQATIAEARAIILAVIDKLSAAVKDNPYLSSYFTNELLMPGLFKVSVVFYKLNYQSHCDGTVEFVNTLSYEERYKHHTAYVDLHQDPKLIYVASNFFYAQPKMEEERFIHYEELYSEAIHLNAELCINPAIHQSSVLESKLEQVLTRISNKMIKEQDLAFEFKGWMVIGEDDSKMTELRGRFQYQHPVSLKTSRKLMLNTIEQLLDAINSSEELRPYLQEYPFPSSRLKLHMFFRWSNPGSLLESPFAEPYENGDVDSIAFSKDTLTYFRYLHNSLKRYKRPPFDVEVYTKETYPEAKASVGMSDTLDMSDTLIEKISDWWTNTLCWIKSMHSRISEEIQIFFIANRLLDD